jgi:hypothetical protein
VKIAIVLFTYNRPKHTKLVLDGLKKNNIRQLYVFSDGPRHEIDKEKVFETRKIIDNIDWCEVIKEYRGSNIGLANSIITGITNIFNQNNDAVIVIEDDCIPGPNFVKFMEKNLEYYYGDKEIMHICGFGLKVKNRTGAYLYVTPYPGSWGWGTWKKYWLECNFNNYSEYRRLLSNSEKVKKFNYAGEAFSEFLKMQINGTIDSWLIRWYFHIFNKSGKCIWPYKSHIYNIGFDGTGVHKVRFDRFNSPLEDDFSIENCTLLGSRNYDDELIREFRRYFMGKRPLERIKSLLYHLTGIVIGK